MKEVRESVGLSRAEAFAATTDFRGLSYESVRLVEIGKTHPSIDMIGHLAKIAGWNPGEYLRAGIHTNLRVSREHAWAVCRMYDKLPRRNQENVLRLLERNRFHTMGDYGRAVLSDPLLAGDPLVMQFFTQCALRSGRH